MKTSLAKKVLLTFPLLGLASLVSAQQTPAPTPPPARDVKTEAATSASSSSTTTTTGADGVTSIQTESIIINADGGAEIRGDEIQAIPGKIVIVTEVNGKRKTQVIDSGKELPLAETLKAADAEFLSVPVDPGEPVTFLGVVSTELSEEFAAQLPLTPGTGLLVRNVSENSPAARAGLQENDVLTKFDDQILVNPAQLAVLVASRKEGDAVKLTYLRKGQPAEAAVTLGKHTPEATAGVQDFKGLRLDTLKPLMRVITKKVADLEHGKLAEFDLPNPWELKEKVKNQEQLRHALEHLKAGAAKHAEQGLEEILKSIPAESRATLRKALDRLPDDSEGREKKAPEAAPAEELRKN